MVQVTTTYEAGDKVYISLKDSDRNGDAGAVEEAKVSDHDRDREHGHQGECGSGDSREREPGGRNTDSIQDRLRHQDRGLDTDLCECG